MKCAECGSKMKKKTSKDYHYIECGLSNVYLTNISIWNCEECGSTEAEIPAIETLHLEIVRLLVTKKTGLNPAEFRFIRVYLGFSSKDLAIRFGVTPETVSRWENKKLDIPIPVDHLLRHMALINEKNHDYSVEDLAGILASRQKLRRMVISRKPRGWTAKVAS